MARSRILDTTEESDLYWYFRDSRGDLGLHGAGLEPTIGGGQDPVSAGFDRLNRAAMPQGRGQLSAVARERAVRTRLGHVAPGHRAVLALFYGPSQIGLAQFYAEFGELAPIVQYTHVAQRRTVNAEKTVSLKSRFELTRVRRIIERMVAAGQKDAAGKKALRAEAEAMLAEAQTAYLEALGQ